ncbi:MAG: HAD family hydrolase [Oscillospiraceae bacterium]|nr:HAD family hydrolase [Oscillospiraceae bacterium]
MLKYQVVIFDFDGTLIDSSEDVRCSLEYAAEQSGVPAKSKSRIRQIDLALPPRDIWREIGGEESRFEQFRQELKNHYLVLNDFKNTAPYPGIITLLNTLLKKGCDMYIVTNKSFTATDMLVHKLKMQHFFSMWYSPDGPSNQNADKTAVLSRLKEKLGNKNAVYIGDSHTDIEAAAANGIPSIGVLYGDGDPRRGNASPNELASDVESLFPLLCLS